MLKDLVEQSPELLIRVLVRSWEAAEDVAGKYPSVGVVLGDLNNSELITREASRASVVLNLASNSNMVSVKAIHKGLSMRGDVPSFWVQISGASLLATEEMASKSYVPGSFSNHVFNDLDGIADLHELIRAYPSREVDNYMLNVAEQTPAIRGAVVFPPIIYGKGEGPGNQRSVQIPELTRVTLNKGHGVQVGEGLSRWGNVHIKDVASIFVKLAQQLFKENINEKLWGKNGLYLAGVGEMPFGKISQRIVHEAYKKQYIDSADIERLSRDKADLTLVAGSLLFGSNARSQAERATTYLGWKPVGESLEEEIYRVVAEEAAKQLE